MKPVPAALIALALLSLEAAVCLGATKLTIAHPTVNPCIGDVTTSKIASTAALSRSSTRATSSIAPSPRRD